MSEIADILDRAADLIEPEGAWTQEYYAVDANGRWKEPDHPDACAFCMVGAVAKAAGKRVSEVEKGEIWRPLYAAVGGSVIGFNDRHSHREVVAKLREAAAKARGGQP